MEAKDIKGELEKGLTKIGMLRDEIRLHLHLASMDAKKEWEDKLEPLVQEAQDTARDVTETSRARLHEVGSRLERFASALRDVAKPIHTKH